MGWAVLYIAFGVVALWLLGEVLLQYKARLRWRLLAFGGFSTVVVGVAVLSSIPVIALGAVAFAVGQTFVTLSYRRGFSTGWALGGKPGSSRRRRDGVQPAPDVEPVLQVSGLETYEPQPMPDDTGGYAVYDRGYAEQPPQQAPSFAPDQAPPPPAQAPAHTPDYGGGWEEQHQYATQAGAYSDSGAYSGYDNEQYGGGGYDSGQYATASFGGTPEYEPPSHAPEPPAYAPQPPSYAPDAGAAAPHPSDGYGTVYATGQYAAQPEPYAQPDSYAQPESYAPEPYPDAGYPGAPYADPGYGGTGYPDAPYPQQQSYGGSPQGGYPDTPPGGVWVPQQREPGVPLPAEQGYPYGDGTGAPGQDGSHDGAGYGYDTSGNGYYDGQRGY